MTPTLREMRDRAFAAMRLAGCRAETIRRIRVRFWDDIVDRTDPELFLFGLTCDGKDRKILIDVSMRLDAEGTLLHECAHAFLWPAQGERYAGALLDDHCPIFETTLRRIRRFYERQRLHP